MGYSKADKAQSHERIVNTAAARFREKGIDGISLADLMKEAGLTHGGFYRHFESREDLVAEAVEVALRASDGTLCSIVDARGAIDLVRYVELYLSVEHRDDPATGCALTALTGDIARSGTRARALYSAHVERLVARLVPLLGAARSARERRLHALDMVSTMAGALSMARAVQDPALSEDVLEAARARLVRDIEQVGKPAAEASSDNGNG
ncbi:TetR/AcrR family transcriptional regulator [Pararobbsia silviterrae]|uniref:TetR/AcrR family transcriptional regulator n=1 Tax=Pararobbsia silviterrae TaxID=1792498 RepID=A0A494XUL0_9BURK|nr:TetR/AcrR family transcriptional regulator [Pararobbsia silviterrae]RKP53391.1 TetR/AcrR family transcriptional regulator [Pararobbsia silviterrae]